MQRTFRESSPASRPAHQHSVVRWLTATARSAQRQRRLAAIIAVCLGVLTLSLAPMSLRPETIGRKDFIQPYLLARAIAEGANPYLPLAALAERYTPELAFGGLAHPTPHPPTLGLLMLPFAMLDYASAATLWLGLEFVLLAASIALIMRGLAGRVSPLSVLAITIAAAAWEPIYSDLIWGQINPLLLLLLSGAWLALRSDRGVIGGILIGATLLVKPLLWPVIILLLLRKQWQSAIVAGVAGAGGYLVAGLLIGFDRLIEYVTVVLPGISAIYRPFIGNISVWSLFSPRIYDSPFSLSGTPAAVSPPSAVAGGMLLALFLLIVACIIGKRMHSDSLALGFMVCVSIAVSPIAWQHYLVLCVLPIAFALHALWKSSFPPKAARKALFVATILIFSGNMLQSILVRNVWLHLAFFADGQGWSLEPGTIISPVASLFAMMSLFAVGALAWLLVQIDRRSLERPESQWQS